MERYTIGLRRALRIKTRGRMILLSKSNCLSVKFHLALFAALGDDSAAIQAAVDGVATQPLANGFRGAVLLTPENLGEF